MCLRKKNFHKIRKWIAQKEKLQVDFPDQTDAIIDQVLEKALQINKPTLKISGESKKTISITILPEQVN